MTQKNPAKRLSASDYLRILSGNIEKVEETAQTTKENRDHPRLIPIPSYFETCIYPLYLKLHWQGVTPDDRIIIICEVL